MSELRAFFVHLRWHYQLLVLPGGFLLGGLYQTRLDVRAFLLQFFVVHLLLNGGVTAYNSYWDDDDGPIGGLEHPPKMSAWMHPASIAVQLAGLPFALLEGPTFVALYVITMVLSVVYSWRRIRWKGHPIGSLICVGVGTGTNTFLMGYLAGGDAPIEPEVLVAAVGAALLLLSLFPVSQVFQIEEDASRGDRTFAVRFGLAGVRRFFVTAYPIGLLGIAATLPVELGLPFFCVGAVGGLGTGRTLSALSGKPEEYHRVMRLKYGASLSFVALLSMALALRHWVGL